MWKPGTESSMKRHREQSSYKASGMTSNPIGTKLPKWLALRQNWGDGSMTRTRWPQSRDQGLFAHRSVEPLRCQGIVFWPSGSLWCLLARPVYQVGSSITPLLLVCKELNHNKPHQHPCKYDIDSGHCVTKSCGQQHNVCWHRYHEEKNALGERDK